MNYSKFITTALAVATAFSLTGCYNYEENKNVVKSALPNEANILNYLENEKDNSNKLFIQNKKVLDEVAQNKDLALALSLEKGDANYVKTAGSKSEQMFVESVKSNIDNKNIIVNLFAATKAEPEENGKLTKAAFNEENMKVFHNIQSLTAQHAPSSGYAAFSLQLEKDVKKAMKDLPAWKSWQESVVVAAKSISSGDVSKGEKVLLSKLQNEKVQTTSDLKKEIEAEHISDYDLDSGDVAQIKRSMESESVSEVENLTKMTQAEITKGAKQVEKLVEESQEQTVSNTHGNGWGAMEYFLLYSFLSNSGIMGSNSTAFNNSSRPAYLNSNPYSLNNKESNPMVASVNKAVDVNKPVSVSQSIREKMQTKKESMKSQKISSNRSARMARNNMMRSSFRSGGFGG